uniref:Putative hydroxypyruvate isomerase n=1 Tax=Cyprinus carpio TaxID=7962 RepID=A0A8C1MQB1_CYPCA
MAPLKFCANITWLFTELQELQEFMQRMHAAARAGFRAERVKKDELTGLEFALINTPPNINAGDLGLAAVPGRGQEFRQGLDLAVQYAKALDCRRIHLMVGRVPAGADRCTVAMEMEDTFVQNLKHAAGVLSKEGILGLIEPINIRITDPQYFLDSPHQAAVVLQRVAHPSIRMQMGTHVFCKNLVICPFSLLSSAFSHIHIAQVPDRHEPDSDGELSFSNLFKLLEELDYQDYIGWEYKPQRSTEACLDWLRRYWSSRN